MKMMLNRSTLLLILALMVSGCFQDYSDIKPVEIAGNAGALRFNLVFDRGADLDLYVKVPGYSSPIFWNRTSVGGGILDADCTCSNCANGPSENIYWPIGSFFPLGTYEYYVGYYSGNCSVAAEQQSGRSVNYTLRVYVGDELREVVRGKLSGGNSQVYAFTAN